MALLKHILAFFLSVRTAIWLLSFLIIMLLAGAFIMPARQEFQTIHSMPLFAWLTEQPLSATWWLLCSIIILGVLAANTLVCSIESIIKKRKVTQWLLLISPQIIHIGFLFILLAHLLGATGSAQGMAVAREGYSFRMADNMVMHIKSINVQADSSGYVSDWEVDVEYLSGEKALKDKIRPNSPSLQGGLNINVKDLRVFPEKAALLQISKNPGAIWALIGGILFMIGTIILVALKVRMER